VALIIEDGTVVANANSYITDAEFTAYADSRGYTYPAAAADREPLIIKAADYLQSMEGRMKGRRTDAINQVLAYPRMGVYLHCALVGSDSIPTTLKNAQAAAAVELVDRELLISTTSENIASQSVGDLSISYHSGGTFQQVRTDTIDVHLDPLLLNGGNSSVMSRF
jgi:hypothetical protein